MTGIYRITSPSGNVYIGQSRDVRKRWNRYKDLKTTSKQPSVFRSFQKYGVENHIFEVVHELPADITQEILDVYEVFYMNQYQSCGIVLLNVKEGGYFGKHTNRVTLEKLRIASTGNTNMLGKKHSEETKRKISATKKGVSPAWNKGIPWSEEIKARMPKFSKNHTPWNKGLKNFRPIPAEERESVSKRFLNYWKKIKAEGKIITVSGEKCTQSKLKIKEVEEIINYLIDDKVSQREIGFKYKVTPSVIGQIKSWKTWKGVLVEKRELLKNIVPSNKRWVNSKL